ncbi:MAG: RES family NAD+ phosphorylase [Bacteroidales bacterium]
MMVFRISKAQFARDLSGRGAQITGGRWNSKGVPMVYTSQSRALCTVEIAVHTPLGNIPDDYMLVSLFIPAQLGMMELQEKELPARWFLFPHPHSTQEIGDKFITAKKFPVMKVPSAVVQGEYNFLLNPLHPEFDRITIHSIEPFRFDERLFKKR